MMTKYVINPSDDNDWYILDEFDAREDAIAEGVRQYKKTCFECVETDLFDLDEDGCPGCGTDYSTFYIGNTAPYIPYVDADDIIERVSYCAVDECGEAGDDYLWDVPKEMVDSLQKRVQAVFDTWLDENNLQPSFYRVENIEKIDAKDYI